MLQEIHKTLKAHQGEPLPDKQQYKIPNKVPDKLLEAFPNLPNAVWNIYDILKEDGTQTSSELARQVGISERMVRKYISMLKANGLIIRIGSNKNGFWKICE